MRRIALGLGHGAGGLAEIRNTPHDATLDQLIRELAQLLSGREAERLTLGSLSSGSGGERGQGSDLEAATRLAAAIELSLGLGARGPLWAPADWRLTDRATRRLIQGHLAQGEALARGILASHREALDRLAAALTTHRALEGDELAALLAGVTARQAKAKEAPVRDGPGEPAMGTARSGAGGAALGTLCPDAPGAADLRADHLGDGLDDGDGLAWG